MVVVAREGRNGLERLCGGGTGERIIHDAAGDGIERMEACFEGEAFSPHRHDTYALGVTLSGVQSFRYRGATRASLPGNCIVIHPDEVHDGAAGDNTALRYRMVYLEPALLLPALGQTGIALPFVGDPVVEHPPLARLLVSVLANIGDRLDELETDAFVAMLAPMLAGLSGETAAPRKNLPVDRLALVRDYLADCPAENISSSDLERVSGLDRFALARHFRSLYGTTPHRFLVMRRLERARRGLIAGDPLAAVAADAGFADQAHFTRHFRSAYGITPGRWARLAQRTD